MPVVLTTDRHFGQQLREYRIKKGISQVELARRIGCLSSNISHFEKGDNTYGNGSIQTVFQYARALGYRTVKFQLKFNL